MGSRRTFSAKDYSSGDGFVTKVWGPAIWHALHTISFNYPVSPTNQQKHQYRDFILSLQHVLPCKYCRQNLKKNFKAMPLQMDDMKSRDTFSRYIYGLHEKVNTMLKKHSGLTYADVRERYEHFRSRCKIDPTIQHRTKTKKGHSGCTEPLYGKKSKCIIKIVPQTVRGSSMQIDQKCMASKKTRRRVNTNPM